MNYVNQDGKLNIPPDYPKFREGSQLFHFPVLTHSKEDITEEDRMVLEAVRPYLNTPDVVFAMIEALMHYFHDELLD